MSMFISCFHYEECPTAPNGYRWVENAKSVNFDHVVTLDVAKAQVGPTYEAWASTALGAVRLVEGAPTADRVVAFLTGVLQQAGIGFWPTPETTDVPTSEPTKLRPVAEPPGNN